MAKWITTKQAAESLGISIRRVQSLIKEGRVPSALKRGRDWYFREDDLFLLYDRKPGRPAKT